MEKSKVIQILSISLYQKNNIPMYFQGIYKDKIIHWAFISSINDKKKKKNRKDESMGLWVDNTNISKKITPIFFIFH